MKLIDLTHKFTGNMPVYPGDAKPEIFQTAFLSQHGYNDFTVKTGMHVGTHIDSPLHFIEGGKRLSEYGPEKFIGRGVLIDARGQKEIGTELLLPTMSAHSRQIGVGDIVLVLTGMDAKYRLVSGEPNPDYFENYPVLTEEFAHEVVKAGIKMIGVDTCSPDKPPYNVHKILLAADILIIENLTNLDQLVEFSVQGARLPDGQGPALGWEVIALPAKYDTEAAPARVIARVI